MCGVPVHRADEYLQRLIKQGYRVAVCEQLEDPAEARKRGAKAVVKRDVVRLVTPGTLTEEALLDAKARNYLTAVHCETSHEIGSMAAEARLAIASLDISTGEFEIAEVSGLDLAGELIRLAPGEVLAPDGLLADRMFVQAIDYAGGKTTPIPAAYFDSAAGARDLKVCLGVGDLAGFGHVFASGASRNRRGPEVRRSDPDGPQAPYPGAAKERAEPISSSTRRAGRASKSLKPHRAKNPRHSWPRSTGR